MLRRSRTTLLWHPLCGKAAQEDLHFAQRLFVAFALRGGDSLVPCSARIVDAPGRIERFAEQLPRRGVIGIELDRSPQVSDRGFQLAAAKMLAAEAEAQERAVLSVGKHALEIAQHGARRGSPRRLGHAQSRGISPVVQSTRCIGYVTSLSFPLTLPPTCANIEPCSFWR